MKLNVICTTKTLHHTDPSGTPIIMVQFSLDGGGIGTLHSYMSEADSNKYALGSKHTLTLEDA